MAVHAEIALLAIKSSFSNWLDFSDASNISGWVKGVPVCNWTGVSCTHYTGRVQTLCATRRPPTLKPRSAR